MDQEHYYYGKLGFNQQYMWSLEGSMGKLTFGSSQSPLRIPMQINAKSLKQRSSFKGRHSLLLRKIIYLCDQTSQKFGFSQQTPQILS